MRAIIVLGAAVWKDGPSPTLKRRTDHAIALWRRDPDQHIIPCGGMGQHPPSEAAAIANILRHAGVPPDRITLEDRSTTTFENLANAIDVMRPLNISGTIIVTDHYHRPRVRMVAAALGLKATLSSPAANGSDPKTQTKQHLREFFAIPYYAMKLAKYVLQRNR